MKLVQRANVTVMVSNLDRAIDFYTLTLGFELKQRFGNHWADVETSGLRIGLHPTSKTFEIANNMQLGLQVTDIGFAIEILEKANISYRLNESSQEKLAFFTDPDGNALYFVQPSWQE